MFSILHISDLHRSRDEPIDNDSLVAALLADCDRYLGETPVVPSPNAIVVSGDIIQGAPIGMDNWQEVMKDQYRVAEDFLDHLTRRFLNGDRSRLIIVPGNHDVCWNTSFASMERIESEYPTNVRKALTEPDSNYRWSWKELALYKIQDKNVYKNRLSAYWNFVESFYADVQLLKPIDRNRGFQLFELHDRKIIVVAFDSISNNDCFSYSGKIPQGAIARSALELRDIRHSYDLRLAVWHHSIHGPPLQDDYMEIGQVHEMVGLGFHLGIHGHQHVAEATTQYIHLSESQAMAVVSAGSLCAGSNELPRGVNRQYNLIVIEDDMRRARVHVREMVEGGQFSRKNNGAFLQGFVELGWQSTTDIMGREVNASEINIRHAILQADEALHMGDPQEAINLLKSFELPPGSYARNIFFQAALKTSDWVTLIDKIDEPHSAEEAVYLISALTHLGKLDQASTLISSNFDIDEATRKDLEAKIEIKRIMRGT
jgi:hypothetical protein